MHAALKELFDVATPIQRKLLENVTVDEVTGCWLWLATWGKRQATRFRYKGVIYSTRTIMFNEFVGPLHSHDIVVSTCKNKLCVCPNHLQPKQKLPTGYRTKEDCSISAMKYQTRISFRTNDAAAYTFAERNGWLDELCSHMVAIRRPNGYWTKERCHDEAKKYNTKSEFENGCRAAYVASKRIGVLEEISSHMSVLQRPNGYWTKERCHDEAKKYNTKSEFSNACCSAYSIAHRNKWLADICQHMKGAKYANAA